MRDGDRQDDDRHYERFGLRQRISHDDPALTLHRAGLLTGVRPFSLFMKRLFLVALLAACAAPRQPTRADTLAILHAASLWHPLSVHSISGDSAWVEVEPQGAVANSSFLLLERKRGQWVGLAVMALPEGPQPGVTVDTTVVRVP